MKIEYGKIYEDSKGKPYQLLLSADHFETGERLAVFQALFGDYSVSAMSFDTFMRKMSLKDKSVSAGSEAVCDKPVTAGCVQKAKSESAETKAADPGHTDDGYQDNDLSLILCFLEAETSEEKLKIIKDNYSCFDPRTVSNMEAAMDITAASDNLDERLDYICSCLRTRSMYETGRLRG